MERREAFDANGASIEGDHSVRSKLAQGADSVVRGHVAQVGQVFAAQAASQCVSVGLCAIALVEGEDAVGQSATQMLLGQAYRAFVAPALCRGQALYEEPCQTGIFLCVFLYERQRKFDDERLLVGRCGCDELLL